MTYKNIAAIIVAAFLLITANGCYTKLKSLDAKLVPDAPVTESETSTETEWDFSWGWYQPEWDSDGDYRDYYRTSWWDDPPWSDDSPNDTSRAGQSDIQPADQSGKIETRGNNDPLIIQQDVQVKAPSADSTGTSSGGTGKTTQSDASVKQNQTGKTTDGKDSTKDKKDTNKDNDKKIVKKGRS